MAMLNILHVTSVHKRYDTRIFLKECNSLSQSGFSVGLLVSDGLGNGYINDIKIIDVGKNKGRIDRVTRIMFLFLVNIYKINPKIIHFHDPELIFLAMFFKLFNFKVVFDFHEDVPLQIMNKRYLSKNFRIIISCLYSKIEKIFSYKFDAIVAATPTIRDKFLQYNTNTIDINNFPKIDEFIDIQYGNSNKNICYIGALSPERGIKELVQSLSFIKSDINLIIAGTFSDKKFEREITSLPSWSRVDYLGFLNRKEIKRVFASSFAGLVTLRPVCNYVDSLPVKMFEYMLSGLPVIASNFELWKKIIEYERCGVCVDPLSPEKIAHAVELLYDNPILCQELGGNGRALVLNKYNWQNESKKLISLYNSLLTCKNNACYE